jgi:hypothetical protein
MPRTRRKKAAEAPGYAPPLLDVSTLLAGWEDASAALSVPEVLDAEDAVLGAMLMERESIRAARAMLRTEDLSRHGHRLVFDAIMDLFSRNEPVEALAVCALLREKSQTAYDEAGGIDFLTRLCAIAPTSASVGQYARLVRKQSHRRLVLRRTFSYLSCPAEEQTAALIESLEGGIETDVVMENVDAIKAEDDLEIDWLIENLIPGEGHVTVLAGEPGAGKSFLSLHLCHCFANGLKFLGRWQIRGHGTAWYIDFDSTKRVFRDRIDQLDLGAELQPRALASLKEPEAPSIWELEEGEEQSNGDAEYEGRPLWATWQTGNVTAGPMIAGLKAGIRKRNVRLLVLDHLFAMQPDGVDFQKDGSAVARAMRHISRLAQTEQLAIIVLNQFNKGSKEFAGSTLSRFFGSMMVVANVDAAIGMEKVKDEMRKVLPEKVRPAKFPMRPFLWGYGQGPNGGTILTYGGEVEEEDRRITVDAKDSVVFVLADGIKMYSGDLYDGVMKDCRCSHSTAKLAVSQLHQSGELIREGVGKATTYRLSPNWKG